MTKWIGLEVDAADLAIAVADWASEYGAETVVQFVAEIDALVADVDFTELLIERLQASLELANEAS